MNSFYYRRQHKLFGWVSFCLLFFLALTSFTWAQSATNSERQVHQLIERLRSTWNQRDLEGFVTHYSRQDYVRMVVGDLDIMGFQNIKAQIDHDLLNRSPLEELVYRSVSITELRPEVVIASVHWSLDSEDGVFQGVTTYTLHQEYGVWKIVVDHTSLELP